MEGTLRGANPFAQALFASLKLLVVQRIHPKIVSELLGHVSITITLDN